MKTFKKLFSVVLTFVLSVFAINVVSAAETGTITVNGTTSGETYDIYKIFNLTYSGDNVAYTIDSDWEAFFNDAGAEYIVDTNTGDLNAITVEVTNEDGTTSLVTKYINVTDNNVAKFAQAALEYAASKTADSTVTATGETVVFNDLALGYYLVYPQGATDIKETYASICSLTSTTPDGEVNIKAEYPTINKTANGTSFEVGTEVTFTIVGQVPDTTGYEEYTYQIKDTMTEGLSFNADVAKLVVTIDGNTLSADSDYNLKIANNGFILTFDMTEHHDDVGKEVKVVYNALVNALAIDSKTTNNSATLTYSNDPETGATTTTAPIEIPVYSSKIEVLKVDGADHTTPLAGAKFVLMNEAKTQYYKISNYGWSQAEDGSMIISVNDIEWVNTLEEATVFTTNEEGIISVIFDLFSIGTTELTLTAFEGLKDGTYYLLETEAPAGYNKLIAPIRVEVNGTTENRRPIPVVEEVTVENNSGTELPTTGGFGTKLFITIGSIIAVVSAIILVTNKRMAKEI